MVQASAKLKTGYKLSRSILLTSAALLFPHAALAQDEGVKLAEDAPTQTVAASERSATSGEVKPQASQTEPSATGAEALLGDIVVTAARQSQAQANQSVPMAITAFNNAQIEALRVNDVTQLAQNMPNVSFEQVTSKATVNFTIRGIGTNSSRVSTAPTVGIFVNGVYLGVTAGVLFDPFDVEGIEVLRGPQGTLFGRNVTGGAVLLNYQRPKAEADFTGRLRLESGPNYNIAVAGGGALSDTVSARLAVIYDNDRGYFNAPLINRKNYGASELITVRPSLRFRSAGTDITLFAEYGRNTGDGPIGYAPEYVGNPALGVAPAPGYKYGPILVTEAGNSYLQWHSGTLDVHQDVGFGENASISSITGYRKLTNYTQSDNDYTPANLSSRTYAQGQEQFSQELRYNGTFGPATFTTGLYYFHQSAFQYSRQGIINASQGGTLREDVYGIFGQVDYELSDKLTAQAGGRFTHESKSANIANLASENPAVQQAGTFGRPGACIVRGRYGPNRCSFDSVVDAKFNNFSPKLSLQYQAAERTLLYVTAQRAYRSGGFNVFQNAPFGQKPYEAENQTALEAGIKSDLFDRKTRINAALFHTKIKGLQRDITVTDDATKVTTQQSLNTADATIQGFEVEVIQQIIPKVVLTGFLGYTHGKYDRIFNDITVDPASAGGPVVNAFDYQQKLTRLMPWSYGLSLNADHEIALGKLFFRASWTHRDKAFFPDYNTNRRDLAVPVMPAAELFDLSFTFEPAGGLFGFSVYGRNLANELTLGNNSPLAYPGTKACACYVNKGRIIGAEAKLKF